MIVALVILLSILLLLFVAVYGLYYGVFCYPAGRRHDAHCIPDDNSYREFRSQMLEVVEDMEKTSFEEVRILSRDGLQLYGKLYTMKEDAPLLLFFHGYHGVDAWDGYGFFKICKEKEINVLMVDERVHGKSEGNVISFGIMERQDCRLWTEYVVERFGEDTDVFLAGVSMGAATVMMASELGLPGNVKGIIADCGYTEPAAIIKEIIKSMKLPVKPIYQLIKLGAKLFGHFDVESASALQSVQKLTIPIMFIHAVGDSIVPFSMGKELYECCNAKKIMLVIPGADHANSAMAGYEEYKRSVLKFIGQNVSG